MVEFNNSSFIDKSLKNLYDVVSRRASEKIAMETIGGAIKSLEGNFDFLKFLKPIQRIFPDDTFNIDISPEFDLVDPEKVAKALESIIRMVIMDLSVDSGLYFISEFKQIGGEKLVSEMTNRNIDLDQIQQEQHYIFKNMEHRSKGSKEEESTVGYDWEDVAKWQHVEGSPYCVLYDKKGEVLDRLNLDRIISRYVNILSGDIDKTTDEIDHEAQLIEKEYRVLKMLHSFNMTAEQAADELNMSLSDLNAILHKLASVEAIHFVSYDEIEVTDEGKNYLSK